MLCHCGGDIDDCEFDGTPEQMRCGHCADRDDNDSEEYDEPPMQPHQERVIEEKKQLDEKREKLTAFIGGSVYRTLEATEQSRLNRQLEAMSLYSNILGERIAAFAP